MNEVMMVTDAEKFSRFILENYPEARNGWEDPLGLVAWYINYGFIVVVLDDDGEIVSLCSGRPVDRPGMGCLPYYFNARGTNLHVDLWIDISGDDRARVSLMKFARVRFPRVTTIAMFRHHEGTLHVYPIERFWKGFEKLRGVKRKRKEYGTT
jgi:hypothetical protein